MANKATGTVYALVDPRDNSVRYIGATTKTLKVRLYGHLKGPTAKRVKAWIDDLAAGGLVPRIEAITENVPADHLRDVEKDEITRRLIAGEQLLNEAATAAARRHIERQRELAREERERAAWEHVAHQVRRVVGGPLPPGDIQPVPFDGLARESFEKMLRLADTLDASPPSRNDPKYEELSRLELTCEKAGEALWRATRPLWGRVRGLADDYFDTMLAGRVRAVVKHRWTTVENASRYLALLPWSLMAVGPWAALAERAGMDITGEDFIEWVSDDASVREALRLLLLQSDDRMGRLSVLDDYDNRARPSTGLAAITAAHHPNFDWFLEVMLNGEQLSSPMADLLVRLEPRALNRFLGPNLAPAIDTRLGLPAGTSRDVLVALLESTDTWKLGSLDRIVARADEAFPTVKAPSFHNWAGPTAPMLLGITASLTAAGVIEAPRSRGVAEHVDEVRALWQPDFNLLKRAA